MVFSPFPKGILPCHKSPGIELAVQLISVASGSKGKYAFHVNVVENGKFPVSVLKKDGSTFIELAEAIEDNPKHNKQ